MGSWVLGLQDRTTVTTPWMVCHSDLSVLRAGISWELLMYRLCPSYKNYCVGSCHPYTENRLYSRYCGDPFVGYEEGTPHVCFPCILFASVVLGISTPSGRRSCCILPLDCSYADSACLPCPTIVISNITVESGHRTQLWHHPSRQSHCDGQCFSQTCGTCLLCPCQTHPNRTKSERPGLSLTFLFTIIAITKTQWSMWWGLILLYIESPPRSSFDSGHQM